MDNVINSAFDAIGELSVADLLEAPELFEAALEELVEGEQAYQTLFRPFTTGESVVKYGDDLAPVLDDEIQAVAEFAEIPVSDPRAAGEEKFKKIGKFAIGIRVSEEQKRRNLRNEVEKELLARARTILIGNGKAALAALAEADVEEYPVPVAWDNPDADIREDFGLVTDLIMGATDVNGNQFGYQPNILWANPVTINQAKRNKTVAGDFIGDMASENPIFKRIGEQPLIGGYLQVVADQSIPVGEAWVGVEQAVGYEAQNGPPETTAFYEERGQSGIGGSTMSWRSDYVHFRGMFVPAPKAIVKLTGLKTP